MTLAAGTRLGPYEIVAPLGAGGMGEVYRARDTRLGRDVAVKVLPAHLSDNEEIRARFEREARTVSSLNHPNICTLFDVGREGAVDYLVMELVEGETLAQRLARGALAPPEVLRFGAQIADALDRAHRAGVVHRDLKPGNVMLTKSGAGSVNAKLMDFGLARATGLAGPAGSSLSRAGLTQSPTVAQPLTAEGTLIGTFQYMAPEQLEGGEADARSDLWALGCVLYEMTTGRRAFEGRSQASLITAIMGTEPPPISQVAPVAPPGLDRLVRTCLTKDPEERAQTAHDVKLQLQGIAEGGSVVGASAVTAGPGVARRRGREPLAWTVAAVAGLSAVAALLLGRRPGADVARAPVQAWLTAPPKTAILYATAASAISPDGRMVVMRADGPAGKALWLQSLGAAEPRRLTDGTGIIALFWSPDSRFIGCLDQVNDQLKTIPVEGGTPTVLCPAPNGRGGTWNARGQILFAPRTEGPLYLVAASGGDPVQASWPDSTRHEVAHRYPCFLPDGKHYLYATLPPGPEGFDIFVGELGSRTPRKLMTARCAPVYAEPGYLLFVRNDKVMAQRFDAGRLVLQGEPIALGDASPASELDAEPQVSASRDGRLVYSVERPPEIQLAWLVLGDNRLEPLPLPVGHWSDLKFSPDDRFLAAENDGDLWRVDVARASITRLTSNGFLNSAPVWSPDGRRIAYKQSQQGREEVRVIDADGSGESRLVTTTPDLFKKPTDWSPAGLVIETISPETFSDLWLAPVDGSGAPTPLVHTRFTETSGHVSPDGRWLAYLSDEAGVPDVYLQSFPTPGHKVRVTNGGAGGFGWISPDILRYGVAGTSEFRTVTLRARGDELEVGEPQPWISIQEDLAARLRTGNFTHDGSRRLVGVVAPGNEPRKLRVILDWPALVETRQ